MKNKNRIILSSTIICGIILLGQITFGEVFPEMTFVNGSLTIAYRIVGYFTFSFFIIGLLELFNVNRIVTVPLGILLFLFFFINSCSEIYPIDTTTEPVDIGVVRTHENGNKLIARRYKNVKTNRIIQDTVLVKDYFIFRQLIEVRNGNATTNR